MILDIVLLFLAAFLMICVFAFFSRNIHTIETPKGESKSQADRKVPKTLATTDTDTKGDDA